MSRRLMLVALLLAATAARAAPPTLIYLVRHAEKSVSATSPDPALTACGSQRAGHLADLLQAVPLAAIYSTEFRRTLATAQAVATAHGLPVTPYSAGALPELALRLGRGGSSALVVGHSNTINVVAGLLTEQSLEALAEHEYDWLYLVALSDGGATLHRLRQGFTCGDGDNAR
jgi:2,3-bisphosphoglycerate-dependent phosphoglycerate mutase